MPPDSGRLRVSQVPTHPLCYGVVSANAKGAIAHSVFRHVKDGRQKENRTSAEKEERRKTCGDVLRCAGRVAGQWVCGEGVRGRVPRRAQPAMLWPWDVHPRTRALQMRRRLLRHAPPLPSTCSTLSSHAG
eukprot:1321276-Rhodomonas_salina.1